MVEEEDTMGAFVEQLVEVRRERYHPDFGSMAHVSQGV